VLDIPPEGITNTGDPERFHKYKLAKLLKKYSNSSNLPKKSTAGSPEESQFHKWLKEKDILLGKKEDKRRTILHSQASINFK